MYNQYIEELKEKTTLKLDFDDNDKEPFLQIIHDLEKSSRKDAFKKIFEQFDSSQTNIKDKNDVEHELTYNAPTKIKLIFLEFHLNILHKKFTYDITYHSYFEKDYNKIMIFFEVRGLLYTIQKDPSYEFEIIPLASKNMDLLHRKTIQKLNNNTWIDILKYISNAINIFKEGKVSYSGCLSNLYLAIEKTLKKICNELCKSTEDYSTKTTGELIKILKSIGFFIGADKDYIIHIIESIKNLNAIIGKYRKKERHENNLNENHILYLIYGTDNIINYLIREFENKKIKGV